VGLGVPGVLIVLWFLMKPQLTSGCAAILGPAGVCLRRVAEKPVRSGNVLERRSARRREGQIMSNLKDKAKEKIDEGRCGQKRTDPAVDKAKDVAIRRAKRWKTEESVFRTRNAFSRDLIL